MFVSNGLDYAFEQFEKQMKWKINSGYTSLVKEINECLNKIMQKTIHNADTLEESMINELTELKTQFIFNKQGYESLSSSIPTLKLSKVEMLPQSPPKSRINSRQTKKEKDHLIQDSPYLSIKSVEEMNEAKFVVKDEDDRRHDGGVTVSKLINEEMNTEYVDTDNVSNTNEDMDVLGDLKDPSSKEQDDKNFKCDDCTYSTSRKDSLRKHINTVHKKERNFTCKVCNFAFTQSSSLNKHMRVKHKKFLKQKM